MTNFNNNVSKYGNQPTNFNGRRYPSKLQAKRASELHLLAQNGIITDLKEEVSIALKVNDQLICSIRVDFVYTDENKCTVYEDTKGKLSREQAIKYKLFFAIYGYEIMLTK